MRLSEDETHEDMNKIIEVGLKVDYCAMAYRIWSTRPRPFLSQSYLRHLLGI